MKEEGKGGERIITSLNLPEWFTFYNIISPCICQCHSKGSALQTYRVGRALPWIQSCFFNVSCTIGVGTDAQAYFHSLMGFWWHEPVTTALQPAAEAFCLTWSSRQPSVLHLPFGIPALFWFNRHHSDAFSLMLQVTVSTNLMIAPIRVFQ